MWAEEYIKLLEESLAKAKQIQMAKNGGQLADIELSQEPSVIPEGALHARKHHLQELQDKVTHKGISVVTVDGEADTYQEIIEKKDSLTQHAEIENSEIIFSKELTDFIEETREEWHKTNSNKILEEVGRRVTKEILFNTDDRMSLIKQLK